MVDSAPGLTIAEDLLDQMDLESGHASPVGTVTAPQVEILIREFNDDPSSQIAGSRFVPSQGLEFKTADPIVDDQADRAYRRRLVFGNPFALARRNELSTYSNQSGKNLQEHNRRQAIIKDRDSKYSPYYKGLTDSSLVINRRRLSTFSPGRESHATTVHTSSSLSTFMEKMREWSSCVDNGNSRKTTKKGDHHHQHAYYSYAATPRKTKTMTTALTKGVRTDRSKRVSPNVGGDIVSVANVKPLKEIVSAEDQAAESDTTTMTMTTTTSMILPSSCDVLSSEEAKKSSTAPTRSPALSVDAEILKGSDVSDDQISEWGVAEQRDHEQPARNSDGVPVEKHCVWTAKYKPAALHDFIMIHKRDKAISVLVDPIKNEDSGHFIFEGPPGVGKRTMTCAMVREGFGPKKVQSERLSRGLRAMDDDDDYHSPWVGTSARKRRRSEECLLVIDVGNVDRFAAVENTFAGRIFPSFRALRGHEASHHNPVLGFHTGSFPQPVHACAASSYLAQARVLAPLDPIKHSVSHAAANGTTLPTGNDDLEDGRIAGSGRERDERGQGLAILVDPLFDVTVQGAFSLLSFKASSSSSPAKAVLVYVLAGIYVIGFLSCLGGKLLRSTKMLQISTVATALGFLVTMAALPLLH